MNEYLTIFFIIMSEAATLFAVIIVIALLFKLKNHKVLKNNAKQFVKLIKNESPDHIKKLHSILIRDYSLDEKNATKAVEELVKKEHIVYSRIIDLYLGGKNVSLTGINDDVKKLITVMHGITSTESKNDLDELRAELNRVQGEKSELEKTNEELNSDLSSALQNMEGMMTEYASMYAGGGEKSDKLNMEYEKQKALVDDPQLDISEVPELNVEDPKDK